MNFKFINYREKLTLSENVLYITDYPLDIIKEDSDLLLFNSRVINLKQLKELSLLSDRILVKEEKETLLFYKALEKKDKDFFNINGYYDCIDISGNFYNFYRELRDNMINPDELKFKSRWKKDVLNRFQKIKTRVDFLLNENEIEIECNLNERSFNSEILKKYNKIIFFNYIYFSKFEKKIIEKIEDIGIDVNIAIQGLEKNYDKNNMKLTNIEIPDDLSHIIIYNINDEMMQIALLQNMNEGDIIVPSLDDANCISYLNKDKIKVSPESFERTNLFKFLNTIREIIENIESKNGKILLKLSDVRKAFYNDIFVKYYSIKIEEKRFIEYLIENDFKYLSKDIWEHLNEEFISKITMDNVTQEFIKNINLILDELEMIYNFGSMEDYVLYLCNDIDFDRIKESHNEVILKFYEGISEISAIDKIGLNLTWSDYFSNVSEGIFRLILKFLRFKRVSSSNNDIEYKLNLIGFDQINLGNSNKICFFGISEGTLPKNRGNDFILNENIRKEFGMLTYQNDKFMEKYRFYNKIFSTNEVIIASISNKDENISRSSFVEELLLNKSVNEKNYNDYAYSDLTEMVFGKSKDNCINVKDNIKIDEIEKEKFDKFNVSYYSFEELKKCQYSFYLKNKLRLEKRAEYIEKIDLKFLGKVVHKVFEYCLKEKIDEIEKGNFNISDEIIEKALKRALIIDYLKTPTKYEKYYKLIIFPAVKESVKQFFTVLESRYNKIEKFYPEYSFSEKISEVNDIDIISSGRIDLYVESDNKKEIFDFKTGSGGMRQLDLYEIALSKNCEMMGKYIYSVLGEKLSSFRNSSDKKELKIEEIEEILTEFFSNKNYIRNISSKCANCDYQEICRMRKGE